VAAARKEELEMENLMVEGIKIFDCCGRRKLYFSCRTR